LLATFGVGLLLMHYPSVSQLEQFGHRQQIVGVQAVGLFPGIVALLVSPAWDDAVSGGFVRRVPPDRNLQYAAANFMGWCGHDVVSFSLNFRPPLRGLTAHL
jgi:hypothetical protein